MAIYIVQELQNGRQVGDPEILDAANLALAKRMATRRVSMHSTLILETPDKSRLVQIDGLWSDTTIRKLLNYKRRNQERIDRRAAAKALKYAAREALNPSNNYIVREILSNKKYREEKISAASPRSAKTQAARWSNSQYSNLALLHADGRMFAQRLEGLWHEE
jgi:hypothetical protein